MDKRRLFGRDGPPEPAHADWSPDGRQIAFQAGRDGDWDVWVANADGSDPAVLVDCVTPCIDLDAPAWSPDGASIAYSRIDHVGSEYPAYVDVLNTATGDVTTVAEVAPGDWATSPRWSPDGRYLAVTYSHYLNAFKPDEVKVSDTIGIIDTMGPREVRLLEDLPDWSWYPDWHPERDQIIFTGGSERWLEHQGGVSNLFSIAPDGTALTQLTDFTEDDNWVAMPAWTPNAESILVTLITPTGLLGLGRASPDGSVVEFIGVTYVLGAHSRQSVEIE